MQRWELFNFQPPYLRFLCLQFRQVQLQHAIGIGCLDLISIDAGKIKTPGKRSVAPLTADIVALFILFLSLTVPLGTDGQIAVLHVYLNVFFFKTGQIRFQLIGVSGVGPKAALAILSVCTPQGLAMAVITGDEKALIAAPGIGKKIAQRIILELKDKLTKEQQEIGMPTAPGIVAGEKSKAVEAAAALAVLGYTQQDIAVAMKGVDVENLPLEEIVRQSLKKMVK